MNKIKQKGFTLVELVIVIVIIAILAAVLMPSFSGMVEKAKYSQALQNATNQFRTDALEYTGNGENIPDNLCYKSGNYYFRSLDGALINCTENDCIKSYLKDKNLSILGDSISTWEGISNDSNEDLEKNAIWYSTSYASAAGFNGNYKLTYWGQLIEDYNMNLCINNSWSGSYCSNHINNQNSTNPDNQVNGWYESTTYSRASHLSQKDGTNPDIIIVFIGTNDVDEKVDTESFKLGYHLMLKKLNECYPNAEIYCINEMDRTGCGNIKYSDNTSAMEKAKKFNDIISSEVSNYNNVHLVDLYNYEPLKGINYRNHCLGDSAYSPNQNTHPDATGHKLLEECIVQTMKNTIIKNIG